MLLISPKKKNNVIMDSDKMLLTPVTRLPPPEEGKDIEKYYTTKNAKTYHVKDCFALRNAREVIELSLAEARAMGKEPCGRCVLRE